MNQINQFTTIEQQLVYVVQQTQKLLVEYENKCKNKFKVILLIGITGAGKSTIFNYLSEAEFDIKSDEFGDELILKSNTSKYSLMKDGMKSVTKEPKYFFNEKNNHLLIDFPGFQDTEGEMFQLIIQILFFKIVTQYPVKVVYVLRHPENSSSNRGVGIQDFINQQFKDQNIDTSKFSIILNSYNEQLSNEVLKKRFQKQLSSIYQNVNENIIIIRKVKNHDILKTQFSKENRDNLWRQLIQTNQIQFKPKIIPNSKIITDYVRDMSYKTIVSYFLLINKTIYIKIQEFDERQLQQIILKVQQLYDMSSNNLQSMFQKFLLFCNEIFTLLNLQIIDNQAQFFQLFEFFVKFSEFIEGFQEIKDVGMLVKSQCQQMQSFLNFNLQQKKDMQKQYSDVTQQQQMLMQASLQWKQNKLIQVQEIENNVENNIKLNRILKQSIIQQEQLDEQMKNYQRYLENKIKEQQKELDDQQEKFNKTVESIKNKYNEAQKNHEKYKI